MAETDQVEQALIDKIKADYEAAKTQLPTQFSIAEMSVAIKLLEIERTSRPSFDGLRGVLGLSSEHGTALLSLLSKIVSGP